MYIFVGAFVYTTIGILLCKFVHKKTKAFEEDGLLVFLGVLFWPFIIVLIWFGVMERVLIYLVTGKKE